jgi:hypothetical protein
MRCDSATYNLLPGRRATGNSRKRYEINDMELCPEFQFVREQLVPRTRENYFWIMKQKRPGEPGRLRFR